MPINIAANMPSLTVEAFLNGAWRDISAWVRWISTDSGLERESNRFTGQFTIELTNTDARFTPANTSGPYASGGLTWLVPFTPVRILSSWASVSYPIAYGAPEEWKNSYPSNGRNAIATIECFDPLSDQIAGINREPVAAVGAEEFSGARISRILTSAAYTGATAIDPGLSRMQATTLEGNALAELNLVADSEGGVLYVERDGTITYLDRASPVTLSRSVTSQVTFGNNTSANEVPFGDPVPSASGSRLVNRIAYARVNGSVQVRQDTASQTRYGRTRSASRTDLICNDDLEVVSVAELDLAIRKDVEDRIEQFTVTPILYPSIAWPRVLARRIRDRVTVVTTVPVSGFTQTNDSFIERIQHNISVLDASWTVTFGVGPRTAWSTLTASRWDTGTWDSMRWFY